MVLKAEGCGGTVVRVQEPGGEGGGCWQSGRFWCVRYVGLQNMIPEFFTRLKVSENMIPTFFYHSLFHKIIMQKFF